MSVTTGTLPTGLTLSSAGVLSGTPTQSGSFPVTLTATNGTLPNATQGFTVAVNAPPAITSAATRHVHRRHARQFTVRRPASRRRPCRRPARCRRASCSRRDARARRDRDADGAFPLVFTATNGIPPDATQNFTLNVVCPAITVNPATMTDGLYQIAYDG